MAKPVAHNLEINWVKAMNILCNFQLNRATDFKFQGIPMRQAGSLSYLAIAGKLVHNRFRVAGW
ncbi:hypothetical protein Pan54_00820 [Rubinisphaera italica]|uniref:Uncharacterized protein n=1 Tax=Rubinisphaera italica TaxID=2527969 RepID=A0A5C5XAG2_9PLAN|nr:hypothetical protein Pan54_00820 [Rubinisphaera italica]